MRPTLRALIAASSAALLALPGAASAQPQEIVPNTGWYYFDFGDLGPIFSPADGFSVSIATPSTLRVVDLGIVGDVFRLSLTGPGAAALTTSAVAPGDDGVSTLVFDGDEAWLDARLSRGELALAPGDWTIAVDVERNAPGTFGGQGAISVSAATVPEPATVTLVAGGLALAALAGARRRVREGAAG